MKIAIFGKPTRRTNYSEIVTFLEFLVESEIHFSILDLYVDSLKDEDDFKGKIHLLNNIFTNFSDISKYDCVYCIGGDGTLLDAVRFVSSSEMPILGVNVGRLGFLANTFPNELIEITKQFAQNPGKVDERTILQLISSPFQLFEDHPFALNEITIHKAQTNDMIIVHTYVNGEFLNSYWCDGLMVSTSTGSTAYNLSCGGPIIMPSSGVFVLTPIAPHSLTVRPFIIPNTSIISFIVESRSGNVLVALDNRSEKIEDKFEIAVQKAPFRAHFLKTPEHNYFNTLRNRLNWGVDSRT